MNTARVVAAIVLPATLAVGLSGCSLLQASGSEDTLTSIEACALGHTWNLDVADLASQVRGELEGNGVPVTDVVGSGTQTMVWDLNREMTITTDYGLTVTTAPAADQVLTVVQTHKGSSTGKVYINAEVGIPREWDGTGFKVKTVADNNGTAVDDPGIVIPETDFDDAVGLEMTCDAGVLTTHPRGSTITQTWSSD
jgi:hypothetical protein